MKDSLTHTKKINIRVQQQKQLINGKQTHTNKNRLKQHLPRLLRIIICVIKVSYCGISARQIQNQAYTTKIVTKKRNCKMLHCISQLLDAVLFGCVELNVNKEQFVLQHAHRNSPLCSALQHFLLFPAFLSFYPLLAGGTPVLRDKWHYCNTNNKVHKRWTHRTARTSGRLNAKRGLTILTRRCQFNSDANKCAKAGGSV